MLKHLIFSIPTDAVRRRLWIQFIENQGFHVNRNSKVCSRHFIPHIDYTPGNVIRRRLTNDAVPSIVGLFCHDILYLLSGTTIHTPHTIIVVLYFVRCLLLAPCKLHIPYNLLCFKLYNF